MSRYISLLIIGLLANLNTFGQSLNEWYLNAGINIYVPGRNSAKSVFPVLGYNRDTSPKLLLGGVGTGASLWRPITSAVHLKVHANFSKHTYWDDPVALRDPIGSYQGNLQGWSSDYVLGIGGTVHYDLVTHLSVGAGLGTQILVASLSRMPEVNGYNLETEPSIVMNKYYKTALPVIPLEVTYVLKNTMINLRYDLGLMNRMKGNLGKGKTEKFGVLTLEVGFRIK